MRVDRHPWPAVALVVALVAGACPALAQDEADEEMTIARYARELGARTTSKLRLQGYLDGATDGILYLNVIAAGEGVPILCPTEDDTFDREAIRQQVDDLVVRAAQNADVAQLPLAHVVLTVLGQQIGCTQEEVAQAREGQRSSSGQQLSPELKSLVEPPPN